MHTIPVRLDYGAFILSYLIVISIKYRFLWQISYISSPVGMLFCFFRCPSWLLLCSLIGPFSLSPSFVRRWERRIVSFRQKPIDSGVSSPGFQSLEKSWPLMPRVVIVLVRWMVGKRLPVVVSMVGPIVPIFVFPH